MADVFFTFSEIDARVQPFILFVRQWAQEARLTAEAQPSNKLTNFMITCLAIFYLQQLRKPILPSANKFMAFDLSEFGDTICQIDASKLEFCGANTDSLEELVLGFFEFYSSFDYASNAVSILTGEITNNATHDSIYIVNPMQTFLNASAIVSNDQRDQFVNHCRMSYDALTGMKYNIVQLMEMRM